MKKAEEYTKDVDFYKDEVTEIGTFYWAENLEKNELIKLIKLAQEDAIIETVNTCGAVGLLHDHILYEIANKLIKDL